MWTPALEEAELILHRIENYLLYREDSSSTLVVMVTGDPPKLSHTRLQWEDERKKEDEEEEDEKEEERKENHTTSKNQILNDCLYNAYFLHPKMAQNKQLTTPWRRLLV